MHEKMTLWWRAYVARLSAPVHAGSLGAFRVLFAVLMLLDTLGERSAVRAARRFQDPMTCVFSMWGLVPLGVDGFHLLFGAMVACITCLFAGCLVLPAGTLFTAGYWYLFFLQKQRWNNHSYLFGTTSTLMLCMDTTRACSVNAEARRCSGWRRRCCGGICGSGVSGRGGDGTDFTGNTASTPPTVPLWQLWLLRVLHFIVYFIAGCKKFASPDWFGHQSMTNLSTKPIFLGFMFPYAFMPVLNLWRWASTSDLHAVGSAGFFADAHSADSKDLEMFHHAVSWVIHATGLWFDLGVGWLLMTPGRTRYAGMFLCFTFHALTTQMFSIGMFPYVSLALLTLWLPPDWPQRVAARALARVSTLVSSGSASSGGGGG